MQAASLPLSIIIVGVGPAEFDGECSILASGLSFFMSTWINTAEEREEGRAQWQEVTLFTEDRCLISVTKHIKQLNKTAFWSLKNVLLFDHQNANWRLDRWESLPSCRWWTCWNASRPRQHLSSPLLQPAAVIISSHSLLGLNLRWLTRFVALSQCLTVPPHTSQRSENWKSSTHDWVCGQPSSVSTLSGAHSLIEA